MSFRPWFDKAKTTVRLDPQSLRLDTVTLPSADLAVKLTVFMS
jgi:hypothetical protein